MRKTLFILTLLFVTATVWSQNVTNVSFHQEGNKVVITYDLDKQTYVSVYMSSDGGRTFGSALQHVTGDVGKNVSAGTGKRIVYDALADYDKLQGEDFVFKVKAAGGCAGTVADYDGNVYNTVRIGEQCWMKENLRTTHFSDGASISLGSRGSYGVAYRYYPNNNSSNVAKYGYLYNWKAVMRNASSSDANPSGIQGICPKGWHVPSHAEWEQLENYVSSRSKYVCGDNSVDIAKALASTMSWNSSSYTCDVGCTPGSNNATGFSAVPAGYYYGSYGSFGYDAYFWSATQDNSLIAYCRNLSYSNANVYRSNYTKDYGCSVRCLRD